MKQLKQLFKLQRRLNFQARLLGLGYTCDVKFLNYSETETRLEQGAEYSYPERIDLNIESWNTWKLSYRLSDGRFITEGRDLSGGGRSVGEVYRGVLRELKSHAAHIKLHTEARETNSVVFGDTLVVVENIERDEYFSSHEAIFKITYENGESSQWYGYNAENALSNAGPWIKDRKPVMISLEAEETKGA